MMNDDWDAVSSPVEPQYSGTTDPWDTVSTTSAPQPQRPKQSVKITVSRRFVLLVLAGLVIVALGSGITFTIYHVSAIHTANVSATATAAARATIVVQANATATATALQQLYVQDTSGTPFINDPLSNNNMGYAWGVQNLNGGDTCFFTGKDYHLVMPNSEYGWMWCAGRNIFLNNFAFQVQENIIKPGDAGIMFGATPNGFYRMDVNSGGSYALYYQNNNNQIQTLQSGKSSAIIAGLNQTNVITLIVNNGILYLYVNNQFVTTANLSVSGLTYTTGTFGFAAANFGQPTEVVYTNSWFA